MEVQVPRPVIPFLRFLGEALIPSVLFVALMAPLCAAQQSASPVQQGEYHAEQLLKLMDTDQNGKVSRAEFMKFMNAEFDQLDTNKNGELDVKELTKIDFGPRPSGGKYHAEELLKVMDTDQSGKISRAEFMKYMNAEFDHLDINHDGELDFHELSGIRLGPRPGGTSK